MPRTTQAKVISVLGDDYGPNTQNVLPDIQQHIDSASVVVDRVAKYALCNKGIQLTTNELELIERWLAAHMYCQMDRPLTSKSSGGASGSFAGSVSTGFEGSWYGLTACRLDYSGVLRNLDKQQTARIFHLHTGPGPIV